MKNVTENEQPLHNNLNNLANQITESMLSDKANMHFNKEQCYNSMLYLAISNEEIPQNLVIKANNIRSELSNFVDQYNKNLTKLINNYEACYQYQQAQKERLHNLPEHATNDDPDYVVEFIRGLNCDYYTFKDAAGLTGFARQTLKRWADNEEFGIKCDVVLGKKRAYLSKESVIKIFKKRNSKLI